MFQYLYKPDKNNGHYMETYRRFGAYLQRTSLDISSSEKYFAQKL
jgi:hypothetical protein